MISRTIVRTRIIQTLFAYYKDGDKTPLTAKKELINSFSDSYSLYMLLLSFMDELPRYADEQLADAVSRARITHRTYTPNRKFIDNAISQQVFSSRALRAYLEENKLRWDSGMSFIANFYKQLLNVPFYKEFMQLEAPSYDDAKGLWRRIFAELLLNNEELYSTLEEMEVALDHTNWATDADWVISFIVKTLKRFEEANGANQPLLPMFDNESELDFAKQLLTATLDHHEEYEQMIDGHLKNWDASRIAYMDRIILETALAEMINFPEIALEVSFNEYIELAKEYSSEKSHIFINGILNEILSELKRENKLLKAVSLKD
ncbi:MAG: transcription antitermination factor NusB [Paludibacteraceae bacterium]|nr:transcription antitermination factor NusB [Paludibacteraceae bacterium]